ncbi:MAG: ferrous iron transport protein B [Desulfitobacteriaceae bacterium]
MKRKDKANTIMRVALAGEPNCGKTTLFYRLTGSRHSIGSWNDRMVEKRVGIYRYRGKTVELIDLPGIYSLTPQTTEEKITCDYITQEHPDVVLNVVNSTDLTFGLLLTIQMMDLGIPMVMVANRFDELQERGQYANFDKLSDMLGMPVVPISAIRGVNIERLLNTIQQVAGEQEHYDIPYDIVTRDALDTVEKALLAHSDIDLTHIHYYAAKLLEGNRNALIISDSIWEQIDEIGRRYEAAGGAERAQLLAQSREQYIRALLDKYGVCERTVRITLSERIDRILYHKYLSYPIFFTILLLIFALVFGPVGTWMQGLIRTLLYGWVTPAVRQLMVHYGAPEWSNGLIVDAIIGGVGNVMVFLPQIVLLFVCLSVMEESGYMARAAMFMDMPLRKIGLGGSSFIPMVMGFGCSIPAMLATHSIENQNEKRITVLIIPLMACGARLTVFVIFVGVFFPKSGALVLFSLYLIGVFVAILAGQLLKSTLFHSNIKFYKPELPPYRIPGLRVLAQHVGHECLDFLGRAKLIFAMTVIVWLLRNFSFSLHMVSNSADSILSIIGSTIAPIFTPLGFTNWQVIVALLSGFVAKETVISTLSVFYGTSFPGVLETVFTPAAAYSFLVFLLLYMPCAAAFSTIKKELGGWRWALSAALGYVAVAYVVALVVYQIGKLL